jgi:tetratricopeptide (TPR) repeat protein
VKKQKPVTPARAIPVRRQAQSWLLPALAAAALIGAFTIYGPALSGPFVFDDLNLPFADPNPDAMPLRAWLGGQRPVLMATFLANFQIWGNSGTAFYHATNILLHALTTLLVFACLRRLIRHDLASALGAGLFLVHPLQTEAVAYIASRSDGLSTFFCYAAYWLFLKSRETGVTWTDSARILALFACGLLTKEHSAVLPAAFLATDFLLEGTAAIKRNLRLHAPVVAGGVLGLGYVATRLSESDTAGFRMADLGPLEYFSTQTRVFWHYAKLVALPLGLNADTEFEVSRSLTDHGSQIALTGIVVLAAAAFAFRKRYPAAALGVFLYLIFLAPTSSFVPIRDLVAERRVYLAFLGISLLAAEAVRRMNTSAFAVATAGSVILLILSALTHARAGVWGDGLALWRETVKASPRKFRPRFQLADAYFQLQRYSEANREFAEAAKLDKTDDRMFVNWALSLDAEGRPDEALEKLQRAAEIRNTAHVKSQIGLILGKQGKGAAALQALEEATRLDPGFAPTHAIRGNVYATQNDWPKAVEEFRRALQLDPGNATARQGLRAAASQIPGVR